MKFLLILPIVFGLYGCAAMSPSTKIFEVAQGVDSKGNPKAIALKVFDSQSDFLGDTEIVTKYVTVRAKDGINNSLLVKSHWEGATGLGRAIGQPLILGPVTGGVLGQAIGQGARFIPAR